MRSTQYSLILIAQMLLLCAMFISGAKAVDLLTERIGTTGTSVDGAPAEHGFDGLRQRLSGD